jgi:hypothetical protein
MIESGKERAMTELTTEQVRSILRWGAIGGILPTLAKIAGTFGANFDAPIPNLSGVAIAVVLYGVIGAVVARGIGNAEIKQAIFAGIAAPAILVSVIAGVSDSKSLRLDQSRPGKNVNISLFSSAYAQTPRPLELNSAPPSPTVAPPPAAGAAPKHDEPKKNPQLNLDDFRSLDVYVTKESNYPIQGYLTIYSVNDGVSTPISTLNLDANSTMKQFMIQIPKNTSERRFVSKTGAQADIKASDFSNVTLSLYPKTTTLNDFLWALGSTRTLGIGEMRAQVLSPNLQQGPK